MGHRFGNTKNDIKPHKAILATCYHCKETGHNHTPEGNTHRFHGVGAFCDTHFSKSNKDVIKYCSPLASWQQASKSVRPRRIVKK